MLLILWILFLVLAIASPLLWTLDNSGFVLINWLGYEVKTNILTAILLAIIFTFLIVFLSYLLTKILSLKFPDLLKIFFKKNYAKHLEKIIRKHHRAFELSSQLLLALEVNDQKLAEKLQKEFSKLVKNRHLNDFFLAKIFFEKKEFSKSYELFAKFSDNKNAKILALKSKLEFALQNHDETAAIAYAKQIISTKDNDLKTAKTLFSLYKKLGLWQDSKELVAKFGAEKFKDELQKRDIAVINTAVALELYQKKNFFAALKQAKLALKAEENFLPALEIMLKSWIKLGFAFRARWLIKKLWRENPHLIFSEIFDLTYRKSPAKIRIKRIKELSRLNEESTLEKLVIGITAFRAGEREIAKEFLRLSLLQQKTYRACKIMATIAKSEGDKESYKKYSTKAEILPKDDHYFCNSCRHLSSKWSAKCSVCGTHDSLEWNN